MAYELSVMQRASARLLRRREVRERKRYDLEQELYRREPRLRQLDRAIRGTMAELAELATSGRAVTADGPEIAAIRAKNQALQGERTALLKAMGYEADVVDSKPFCPLCGDRGWLDTEMCGCLKELCAQ